MRCFIAVTPPADVVSDIDRFLEPRRTATAGFQIEHSHSIESLTALTEEQRDENGLHT